MGGDAAHGVEGDWPSACLLVLPPEIVRPRNIKLDRLLEGGVGKLAGDAADGAGGNAAGRRHRFRRIVLAQEAFGDEGEARHHLAAIIEREATHERRIDAVGAGHLCALGLRIVDERRARGIAEDEAIVGAARILDHQPRRIGEAQQIFTVDLLLLHEHVDQGAGKQAIGAGADADPFIGNRGVARLHRIDRDDLGAARLELAQPHLDRVRGMVFGHAEEHEVFRMLPVRLAEFPEAAAIGVEAGRRHVDRAEAAVGGVVGRAELRGPPAGQGLRLVAAREERETPRILAPHFREPQRGGAQRLFPADLTELAGAARPHADQRFRETRRRGVLHDARGTLAADHALVHGVVAVAFDVFDRAILQIHLDAATAGAHVAGGCLDLVPGLDLGVDGRLSHLGPVSATVIICEFR